jgi:hypothetical protein
MKRSVFFASLTLVAIFMSCGAGSKSQSAPDAVAVDSVAPGSYARISAPESIDMGVFDAEHLQKSVVMKIDNVGTDTLYISSLLPECDCTTLEISDSAVAPKGDARITVTMDMSEYTPGKIRKSFSITSNSVDNHVLHIGLDCIRE